MINALTSLFYGLSIATGFILANFLLWRSAKKADLSVEIVFDWAMVMTIFAIIGGRLFFIISHFSAFAPDIFRWIHFIRYPGISSQGALLTSILAGLYFLKTKKVIISSYLDVLVLPLLYFMLFTQFGCLVNNCIMGTASRLPWGIRILGISQITHPLSLYFLISFLILIYLFKKAAIFRQGTYFLGFLTSYFFINFALDNLAANALYWRGLNLKVVFNLFGFLLSFTLLLMMLGPKRVGEMLKERIAKIKTKGTFSMKGKTKNV